MLQGVPLTVTDPKMTRFLMSIDDAVELVLHAFEHSKPGEIFVQKAPASTIGDLAEAMRKIFDLNRKIQIIGTRQGEKRFETLISREELSRSVESEKYYRIQPAIADLDYNKFFVEGSTAVSDQADYNSDNTLRLTLSEVVALLRETDVVREAFPSKRTSSTSS